MAFIDYQEIILVDLRRLVLQNREYDAQGLELCRHGLGSRHGPLSIQWLGALEWIGGQLFQAATSKRDQEKCAPFPIAIDCGSRTNERVGTKLTKRRGHFCPSKKDLDVPQTQRKNPRKEPHRWARLIMKGCRLQLSKRFGLGLRRRCSRSREKMFRYAQSSRAHRGIRCARLYLADCEREQRKRCFAKTYLSERRWEGFAVAPKHETDLSKRIMIFKGTRQMGGMGEAFATRPSDKGNGRT